MFIVLIWSTAVVGTQPAWRIYKTDTERFELFTFIEYEIELFVTFSMLDFGML